VRVDGVDLLTRDIHARLVAKLDDEASADGAATEEVDDAEEASAGPLTLAIDVNEETPPAEGSAATPA
jgi:exoribonuclease-2